MRQPRRGVPQGKPDESMGRCRDRQRSPGVKLFHYQRTRVVFIRSLLHLRRELGRWWGWRWIFNPAGEDKKRRS